MKDPMGVSPSKGNQGTTRGKEKILLTSVGIEPTTSGLDLRNGRSNLEVVGPLMTKILGRDGEVNREIFKRRDW